MADVKLGRLCTRGVGDIHLELTQAQQQLLCKGSFKAVREPCLVLLLREGPKRQDLISQEEDSLSKVR